MLLKTILYLFNYLALLVLINTCILPLLQDYVCFKTLSALTITNNIILIIILYYDIKWRQLLVNLLGMFKNCKTSLYEKSFKLENCPPASQILEHPKNLESTSKLKCETEQTNNTLESIGCGLNVINDSDSDMSSDASKRCEVWIKSIETDATIHIFVIEELK